MWIVFQKNNINFRIILQKICTIHKKSCTFAADFKKKKVRCIPQKSFSLYEIFDKKPTPHWLFGDAGKYFFYKKSRIYQKFVVPLHPNCETQIALRKLRET